MTRKKETIDSKTKKSKKNKEGVKTKIKEDKVESETEVLEENEGQVETEEVQEEANVSIEQKYDEINNKYLRLSAEFDNFRKRSLKEKMDLIKSAGEDILVNILPVIDNFERALKSIEGNDAEEESAIKEGIQLIYTNFIEFLSQRGIKEIEAIGNDFDTDLHEAISKIPAPEETLKGKVIDVVEKGYLMHEKVIRFAKVVVGE